MYYAQQMAVQSSPQTLSRHFSVNPWNTNMDESKISVRTFKDGTKAIEVMEPEPLALEAEAK